VIGLSVALGACGGKADDPTAAEPVTDRVEADAGAIVAPAQELLLGTGEDDFVPVLADQTLPLSRGNQGLQHLWVSLRIRGLAPERAIVALSLQRVRDGLMLTNAYRARLPFRRMPDGEWSERTGIQLVIPAPLEAIGEDLLLSASVEDGEKETVSTQAAIRMDWEEQL